MAVRGIEWEVMFWAILRPEGRSVSINPFFPNDLHNSQIQEALSLNNQPGGHSKAAPNSINWFAIAKPELSL